MKKLLLILLLIPAFSFAQSGAKLHYSQYVTADTITADTGYVITTSADYTWMIYTTWASTTTSTSTVTLQTTGNNGTNWIAEPNNSVDSLNAVSGETLFQGDYMPGYKYRLFYDVASGETIIVNAWYTLKKK